MAFDLEAELPPDEIERRRMEAWRSRMDSAWERAARRTEAERQQQALFGDLERRRKEARERRELEERRRAEAAAKAIERQKEAEEYSKWREDVVLARKADETKRTAEFVQWRSRIDKLRRGLPVPAPQLGDPSLSAQVHVDTVSSPPQLRALVSTPRGATPRAKLLEKPNYLWEDLPDYVSGSGLEAASKLEEEKAWQLAVSRNRETIAEHRKAAAKAMGRHSLPTHLPSKRTER
mmetsp:Transcript_20441/g.36678  ORF Transcript_20441/g.36678 Transcript_20441/m.36678 type:complete len:235 (+) Transcript_20441:20-724(+)